MRLEAQLMRATNFMGALKKCRKNSSVGPAEVRAFFFLKLGGSFENL